MCLLLPSLNVTAICEVEPDAIVILPTIVVVVIIFVGDTPVESQRETQTSCKRDREIHNNKAYHESQWCSKLQQ
jgi:hypothetical protein